ncbi:MAG: LptA/OstA family protein [Comamonadaceae bacterium]|nr:LptA/OstA family protein [Comamonadaceae bacterium]
MSADDTKKEAVYEGNVVITQGTMRITSRERIVVREDPEGYRSVRRDRQPGDLPPEARQASTTGSTAPPQRAEFDDRNDQLRALRRREAARARRASSRGDFISYDRAKEFFEVTGAAAGLAGRARARA